MGDKITLALDERKLQGKKVAKLRKDGLVPGVVYGPDVEPTNVQADSVIIKKTIDRAGYHTPVQLTVGSKKHIAMVKDVDIDPVKNSIRHVSFHAVNAKDPVNAIVPIHLIDEGESEAEKAGLIVLQSLDSIEVRALPMDLPEALEVSVTKLHGDGDRLTVGYIELPEGFDFV